EMDLKSIVATFRSVFPEGTVWLVGGDDVLLLATMEPIEQTLERVAANMKRPDVAADLASLGIVDPFSMLSLYVGGPRELAGYASGAPIFTDDRMTLEFSAPRELHHRRGGENGATLLRLLNGGGPPAVSNALKSAGAAEWRNRAGMMLKADVFQRAYDDYTRALTIDPNDPAALEGFVKTAIILKRAGEAVVRLKPDTTGNAPRLIALSKLLAANDQRDEAIATARAAAAQDPVKGTGQLASLHADSADTIQLDAAVAELRRIAPDRAETYYYAAVAAFLHGDAAAAIEDAKRAIAIDPDYAPTYDLIGAAYTKAGQIDAAREAFNKSLAFDAHDSTAYENLGVLELNAGNRALATKYFAEALWLVPDSQTARQGLARAKP
ncbi:MAG: hypothetical protein ABI983_03605, partial [Acidobacteriota bacterium]